jgi:4'-phosphopantetheinyl transferase EntD
MADTERLFQDSGVLVAGHSVTAGLERFLTAEEAESLRNCAPVVRDRAAAARIAARSLFAEAGVPSLSMPRKHGNAPDWPPGFVASLSHANDFAVAAVARARQYRGIGIDVEPAEKLPQELRGAVLVAADVPHPDFPEVRDRAIFCAKEAKYKAVYPLDQQMLDFSDVAVDLVAGRGETNTGRVVSLSLHVDTRIVVLACLSADPD